MTTGSQRSADRRLPARGRARVVRHRPRDLRARLPDPLRLVVADAVQQGVGETCVFGDSAAIPQAALHGLDRLRLLEAARNWNLETVIWSRVSDISLHCSFYFTDSVMAPDPAPASSPCCPTTSTADCRPTCAATSNNISADAPECSDVRRQFPIDRRAAAVAQRRGPARRAACAEGISRRRCTS